jgi:hypothetical protein
VSVDLERERRACVLGTVTDDFEVYSGAEWHRGVGMRHIVKPDPLYASWRRNPLMDNLINGLIRERALALRL